jgi:hypothetical protein
MQHDYMETLQSITENLTEEEKLGLPALKKQLLNGYLNLGKEVHVGNRRNLKFTETSRDDLRASREEIIAAIEGKNCTVMFGAGKDSSFVLTIARVLQLELLEEYGTTFELRVGMGRHPGMIDCMQTIDEQGKSIDGNIEKVLKALDLHDDQSVKMFFIDNQRTTPYSNDLNNPDSTIPTDVTEQNRNDVLINGHMWGGAGRRTFCDDCNKNLSRWIATALAYEGGADLYMTGDSRKELNAQIGTDVPKIMDALGVNDNDHTHNLSPTQEAFRKLDKVGTAHTKLAHGDTTEDITLRHIPYENVPERTRLVTVFDQIEYDSNKRMAFFHDFLKFDFDSLMFSFTETDCGNPALMCHNIGLIAEAIGGTYADGIRAYVDYGISKMEEKGFADELIEKMRVRYEDDAAINHMRAKVEDYARRAYHLEPQHLEAMAYAPFTERGKNLDAWLEHVGDEELRAYKDDIRTMISQEKGRSSQLPDEVTQKLEEQTGLTLDQMRHLYKAPLMMDNLNQHRGENVTATRFDEESDNPDLKALVERRLGLGIIGANDSLYQGTLQLSSGQELPVMGR